MKFLLGISTAISLFYMVESQTNVCDVNPNLPNADTIIDFNTIATAPTNEYRLIFFYFYFCFFLYFVTYTNTNYKTKNFV